jgi:undecaprenyl-diphosphatase
VNSSFLSRYEVDQTAPTGREALRDAALRVLAPAAVLWAVIVGIGYLIINALGDPPVEDEWTRAIQKGRTAAWDTITMIWSRIGNTEIIIGTCVVVCLVLLWRTRQWWYAVIPAIAISVQASVFVLATVAIGRPRPDAAKLDPAPPTSSYPSGHVGAATALYLTFAFMAQRIETPWLRRVLTTIFVIVPLLVAYARFYRGMHHLTDILIGLLNGVVCALLAWHWLRRRSEPRADDTRADDADAARAKL